MPEHSCGCDRRGFLSATAATAAGALTLDWLPAAAETAPRSRDPARVRAVFVYPPSTTFSEPADGWWSWPGNDFDAEGRQQRYTAAMRAFQKRLPVAIQFDAQPVASAEDAQRVAAELGRDKPDGLAVFMFFNRSLAQVDVLLKAAEEADVPVVFYIPLGAKHGPVTSYRRPGVYLIQSLENMGAIEYGLRMIGARKRLAQSLLLSINEAKESREAVEPFLGVRVRVVPFAEYAAEFGKAVIDVEARQWIDGVTKPAKELRGVTREALENAARAHIALRKLLAVHGADGLAMNCLRRGMLKPCISFSRLNGELIPAVCENDLPAACGQLLGQLLTGRPGFQHNPCYETEANHYYASHCTCPTRLAGPAGPESPYLLRRFAHTNEGSCAIQVFWTPGEPVTMVHYYRGDEPALDVYSGRVVKSHPMPPAAGCTTNVEIEITDRPDACMVRGHHNVLFCGDYARQFRLFAQLFKMKLAEGAAG